MRRAAKIDGNQVEIVAALRAAGCTVLHMHQLGHGAPDLAAGKDGRNWFFECKSGRGMLTPDEVEFFRNWQGQVVAVYSAEDALRVIGVV